jgi:Restriction endonuclease S subunits
MNNELRPYDGYKKTDLLWLDSIPEHWEMTRNKNVMMLSKDTVGKNHSNYVLLSLTKKGIIARDMENAKGKFPKEFDTYQVVNPGDIVFCLFDIDETPRTVGLSSKNGMITGAYTVFKIENINPKYLYYYYLSIDNNKKLKPLYTGLRKVINTDTFLRTKMPNPPQDEQDKIVKFLDFQLSKINKFIKAKKKLIAALKEQKQAVINEAVTKGINPNVKMKASGIDWLGDIPGHWKCEKVKKYAKLNPSKGEAFYKSNSNEKVVFLPMDKISTYGEIDNSDKRSISDVKNGFTYFEKDDVVVAKITPCFENGKGACLDKLESNFGFGTTELVVLRANKYMLPQYLYLITRTSYFRILGEEVMTGSAGQKRIPTEFISNFKLGIPDVIEQEKIIDFIYKRIDKIEQGIVGVEKEIELITEYRTSLISDVVTGKVDVRNIIIDDIIEEDTDIDETEDEIIESEEDINIGESED